MSYKVYKVTRHGAPRDHQAIFVETETETDGGSGTDFHVTGTIQNGMSYEINKVEKPEDSLSFAGKEFLGVVSKTDLPRVGQVCSDNPPPKKQFQGPKRLYPREPLRTCQEWASESIKILRDEGVIRNG